MGIIHIPRVVASCVKGAYARHAAAAAVATTGMNTTTNNGTRPTTTGTRQVVSIGTSPENPHVYRARVGLFDVDAFNHLNHASYLVHAELARWEWSATLAPILPMVKEQALLLVTGAAIRYRREIGPFLNTFEVHTHLASMDERNIWVYHTFRYPKDHDDPNNNNNQGKILAQLLIQAAVVHKGKVINPQEFLQKFLKLDPSVIKDIQSSHGNDLFHKKRTTFGDLESLLRTSAAEDDATLKPKSS
jgi:acyl-CoA thioesterase FadM